MNVSTQCPPGSFVYTVRAGDTLFRLAQTYNTTVNAIIAINPGINPNALQIGQRICIPGAAPVVCPENSFPYVIRSGDTLFALAQRFGTTVAAIIAINPGINPNALQVGQTICIPGEPTVTCPMGSFSYTIQRGDTLFALAQRFNTTVAAILALNPGIDPNALQVGRIICIPGAAPPTCPTGSFSYTIQRGDTLFALAQRFNTTVSAILTLNPGLDPNALQVGQRICIPGAAPPTCPTGSVPYVIRSGDTLFAIAQRFGTTVSAILAINPGIDPNALRIGQTICVPQAAATCPGGTFYTIQPGDTLFLIATRFDVSVNALQSANPGLDPARLVPGQRICIPGAQPITCPGNNTYLIQQGETLSSIAEKFTVSAADILVLNPGLRPSDFIPGRTICLPTTQAPV